VLVDDGARPGVSTVQRSRIAALERENRELRRANAILKAAALKSTRQRNVTMIQAEVLHGEDWETGVAVGQAATGAGTVKGRRFDQ
jgi:hypothetical protein